MSSEEITVNASDREYRKKRVEELGNTLAKFRARVKATRGSGPKKDDENLQSGGSKPPEDTERTALSKKLLEEDRARFTKLQQNRVRMKEEFDQILIEREEQKKVEKQIQEAIAKVTAPTPELPPLIKQRIIDLETTVENLKERLSEKDKVLSSKTQALTVLHNQLMQRSQEQVEKAMAFTQEISTLKEDYGKREEVLKSEISRLKEREEELECRLSDKEMHSNEFLTLQAELAEVRQELNEALNKNEESSKNVESINKINLKLKAQLKAMKIERDKLKQAQENIEDLEELKNRIALLEEEKESLTEAETKSKHLENELTKFKEENRLLHEEKRVLQENLESTNEKIAEQNTLIHNLKSSLKEMEESKISAEMRSIEIEEKMEELRESSTLKIEQLMMDISALQDQIDEKNAIVDSLNNQLSLKEQEISDIKGNNFPAEMETDYRIQEIESYNSELVEKVRELQLKSEGHEKAVIQLNDALSEKNETINNLKVKYEELKTTVNDLNNNKTSLENEIKRLKANAETVKKETQSQETPSVSEHKEDPNLTQKFKKLAANYKIKVKLCQELEEKLKLANTTLEEKIKEISDLTSQVNALTLKVDEFKNNESLLRTELENINCKNEQLMKYLEDMGPKMEAMEVERTTAVRKADKMNKAFEELKEWKEGDSKLLKEHVTSVNSMATHVSLLEEELKNLQSIVSEKNSVIGELETERKKLVEDMRNSEFELERLRGLYEQESVKNQNFLTNLQGLESEMLVSREEMNQIAEQLDAVTKNYNMCLANLQERENYIETLEQDIVGMKTKMYNLEAGIGDKHRILEERGNQLSARLEEAEILSQTFDKYQAEMDMKFKKMEDNEKSMKSTLLELQNEINQLNKLNHELKLKNESKDKEITEMSEEINTLKDVKNSYNSTLDRIEVLNEDLKQVMGDFEAKNQELLRLAEERSELFNKLTDLEDAYSDLRAQLDESEENTSKLQADLQEKTNLLQNAQLEVRNLQQTLNELTINNEISNQKVTELPKEDIIQVFSWDQHSQAGEIHCQIRGEGESLNIELNEVKMLLSEAQKEIYNLQLQKSSILTEKDSEINLLKEQITRISSEYEDLNRLFQSQNTQTMPITSWDQQNQASSNTDYDNLRLEFEDNKRKLESAENEIINLKTAIDSTLTVNDSELTRLKEENQRLLVEKENIEKCQSNLSENKTEIKMFSWGSVDQVTGEDDGLKMELQEKTQSLIAAHQEIANLQAALSSMLSEKESEVSVLRDEIQRLTSQKEDLENSLKADKSVKVDSKQEDIRMFSWGQHNQEIGKDEEDGWGWIGAEAHLEQDHKHSEALQIQTLTQRVRELEAEQESLNEKLNASKIKCIKLIKKLKEMEAVHEQTRSERNVGFSDLDFALQEELRSQLDQLESKNKELLQEIQILKSEKENLNKKADVLITANEQLIEMKERQDIEVQMWQKRSAELRNEIQGLQWSMEELKSETPSIHKGEGELAEKLNALAAENEQLQSIICNLKDGRPLGCPDITAELNALKEDIRKQKEVRTKEKESYENELKKANEELDALEQQFDSLSKENQLLKDQLTESTSLKQEILNLNEQIKGLTDNNRDLEVKLSAHNSSELYHQIQVLTSNNAELNDKMGEFSKINDELVALKKSFDNQIKENEFLKKCIELNENMKQDADSLLEKIQQLGLENALLKEQIAATANSQNTDCANHIEQIETLKTQLNSVHNELNAIKQEFHNISVANQSLQQELLSVKEAADAQMKNHISEVEKTASNVKHLQGVIESTQSELRELGSLIDEMTSKYQVSVSSNNTLDKLKTFMSTVESISTRNTELEMEVKRLIEEPTSKQNEPSQSIPIHLGSTPPVFKGFSSFQNDAFDSIHSSQSNEEVEKLKLEKEELKSVIQRYEQEVSRLNGEKASYDQEVTRLNAEKESYENIISDLKTEIASMNEHIGLLNLQHANQSDDRKLKQEILQWREQADKLRREINVLVEKHSHEIEELRRNEERSKQKLSDIEENYQNTFLNKDQDNRNLKQMLSEKEQLLANAINERNALQTQFESMSQQFFALENRLRGLTEENNELQGELNHSRGEENTVIERQKEEIQELMAKLEYMSQSQTLRNVESENEQLLKQQIAELRGKLTYSESSNIELQSKIEGQANEIAKLNESLSELRDKGNYLEKVIREKQQEIDAIKSQPPSQTLVSLSENDENFQEKLAALIKEKDLEIARVSKVLLDTQERLVHVQDSKPMDKVLSLQAKLDQALQTVHLRDVRCYELEQEIMQLLEERDALQLRLSEVLRENEIIRKGTAESAGASSPELKNKLGELHNAYKRDPIVQMEMESRHNQQIELYNEKEKEDMNATVDYGIFNWFFSSPSPQPPQQ